ncbi:MAG: amidohydrolase family protein [Lentisphaeria bacterium]|nr:amidohydrolase family protein [Lentisphaeria bacterium]
MLQKLSEFRIAYRALRERLPFLDCYISDMAPEWDDVPPEPPTDYRKLSFDSGNPRLVMQTKNSFEEIENMAKAEPEVNFIIASGDQKMLYHRAEITRLIREYRNIFVATANVCNLSVLEDLVADGLADKLLYGSMAPYLDPAHALCQVALGRFDWKTKCAIAGNNLRRLLGEKEIIPDELPTPVIPRIIVDAHAHTADSQTVTRFPIANVAAKLEDWEEKLEFFGMDMMFFTPSKTTRDVAQFPAHNERRICVESKGKVRYFEVFDPRQPEISQASLEKSLPDPMCVGIKIHPPAHKTDANAPEYEPAYELARRYGKPVMTHSWGESYYNATQIHSTAEKFDPYLSAYPQVKFCFGHTGGRPNGFILAAEMINKHPQTMGDLSGDLFNNGFIAHALKDIGADRLMYGTDIYWIDPRCVLGMLLESEASDEELLKILRLNAIKFYNVE